MGKKTNGSYHLKNTYEHILSSRGSMLKTIVPLFLRDSQDFYDSLEMIEDKKPDYIELRLDNWYPAHSAEETVKLIKKAKARSSIPWIGTLRTKLQGCNARVKRTEYLLLVNRLFGVCELVDVELPYTSMFTLDEMKNAVLSFHDFEETPDDEELQSIWKLMDSRSPAVEKIAVMPKSEEDVERLLKSCKEHEAPEEKIAIAMGELGKESRLHGDDWGSAYTFCTVGTSSAPGQLSLDEFRAERKELS